MAVDDAAAGRVVRVARVQLIERMVAHREVGDDAARVAAG